MHMIRKNNLMDGPLEITGGGGGGGGVKNFGARIFFKSCLSAGFFFSVAGIFF